MKINIIAVGKIQNKDFDSLCKLYQNRIQKYTNFQLNFVKPVKISTLSDKEIIEKEEKRLLEQSSSSDYIIALDQRGKQMSSDNFASFFSKLMLDRVKNPTFIIGGPLGLGKNIIEKSSYVLSLSKMTFVHEQALVLLLEQIYRSMTILKGEKYHK